ncbi:MAG TPA: SRPBCC family protein [Alphaproteobacteria bacterium]|nr:SRPBCC family protein [Alphaproteobacteria bacterium]
MTTTEAITVETARPSERELTLTCVIDAPPAAVYRAWTEPELMKQWFAPRPYTTPVIEVDVRPGGGSHIVMRAPDGNDIPMHGVYLEVVENARLVFTDAYSAGWQPAEKPFMTAIIALEDLGGGRTRYTATLRHWSAADCDAHEQMGFHEGWPICARQLAAVAERL